MDKKRKKSIFQLLLRNQDFARFFLTVAKKHSFAETQHVSVINIIVVNIACKHDFPLLFIQLLFDGVLFW